jgi:hypothetical protein
MLELAEAEEAGAQADWSGGSRMEPKVVLRVVLGSLEKSTSSLLESGGYFCLEAHQVLRLADILTFTVL